MELELKRTCLDAYETGGELILTQEETAETIVPDYCPDIARIISTEGTIFLHGRELREGKAEVSGTVRVSVLYTPEGESGIKTLEFSIPFVAESDSRALLECTYLIADAEVENMETRMLNPRKVFTHCKLITRIIAYRKKQLQISTDIDTETPVAIEKRQENQSTILLNQIAEKDFTFTDIIHLSPGREGAVEVLNSQLCSEVTETKIVGNKLIFKGLFVVSVLYRSGDGTYGHLSTELPFSQIVEIDGASENTMATVRLQFTGSDLQIDSDDPEGRQFAVTLYIHATAMLRQESTITLLTDLYSTAYETSYEADAVEFVSFWEGISRRLMVREIMEIGVVAESVLSVHAVCGPISITRERENTLLRTAVLVRTLYLDEGNTPLAAERSIDVVCQLELPQDCALSAKALCTEVPQATLGDRGIEVRFPVDFYIEAYSCMRKACITAAQLDTDTSKNTAGTPSLVLRRLSKQESLWDLAKGYNTTIPAILAANQLECEENVSREQLLLIPKKRA